MSRLTVRASSVSWFLVSVLGCSDEPGRVGSDAQADAQADTASDTSDDTAAPDAPDVMEDAAAVDTVDPATVPLIGEALSCGARAEVGGVPRGEDLVRHTLDVASFPDALCNDGSTAVFYYRPYEGEANRDKWVIQLKGGGGCHSADTCALRWCSVLTNFGKTQMVDDINRPALATIGGRGILARRDDNPWTAYNHVYVQYCSSDGWGGTARDVVLDTHHPCDPDEPGARCPDGSACPGEDAETPGLCPDAPVRYRIHFLGSRIVDAVLSTLRRDGVAGAGAGGTALPDLDEAEHVVFAGSSAGGAGIVNNLDRVAALLREHNVACQGASCPLEVDGVIDSIFMPSFEGLDFTGHPSCPPDEPELCAYEAYYQRVWARRSEAVAQPREDESCATWHAANDPDGSWRCAESAHVISHHLTTPFVMRMGLNDQLLAQGMNELGLRTADGEPIDTPLEFAALMHPQLEWFSRWADEAEERDLATMAPGIFAPGCPKHETLSEDTAVYDATIQFQGQGRDFFELWMFWKLGGEVPAVLVADTPADSRCE